MIGCFSMGVFDFFNGCKHKKSPCSKFKTRRRASTIIHHCLSLKQAQFEIHSGRKMSALVQLSHHIDSVFPHRIAASYIHRARIKFRPFNYLFPNDFLDRLKRRLAPMMYKCCCNSIRLAWLLRPSRTFRPSRSCPVACQLWANVCF